LIFENFVDKDKIVDGESVRGEVVGFFEVGEEYFEGRGVRLPRFVDVAGESKVPYEFRRDCEGVKTKEATVGCGGCCAGVEALGVVAGVVQKLLDFFGGESFLSDTIHGWRREKTSIKGLLS